MQKLGITVTAVAYLVHESARYGCDASIFSRIEILFTNLQKYMETGWDVWSELMWPHAVECAK